MKNQPEKMTLEKLAVEMRGGFARVDKKIERLADTTKKGFDDMQTHFDGRIDGLEGKVNGLDIRIGGLDTRTDGLDSRLASLEYGQGRIERKLDHAIYESQFERLETRVEKIEHKIK